MKKNFYYLFGCLFAAIFATFGCICTWPNLSTKWAGNWLIYGYMFACVLAGVVGVIWNFFRVKEALERLESYEEDEDDDDEDDEDDDEEDCDEPCCATKNPESAEESKSAELFGQVTMISKSQERIMFRVLAGDGWSLPPRCTFLSVAKATGKKLNTEGLFILKVTPAADGATAEIVEEFAAPAPTPAAETETSTPAEK